jgi:hypothetical protein
VLARQLLINFVTYNPMFLFSAMLVLGGAMLLNPPSTGGGRELGLLVKLFAAIQVYELCLLGAAAILHKRGDLKRDVRNLSLVLSPFLVDVTFTTATLVAVVGQSRGLTAASSLVALVLALAVLKLRLLAPLTGKRFDGPVWTGLMAGPLLVTLYPFVVGSLAFQGVRGDWMWLLGGASIGAVALLFAWLSQRSQATTELDAQASRVPLNSWQLRCLSAVPLAVGAYHVLGTGFSWSANASDPATYLLILGPILLAAGLALPRLVWPHLADDEQVTSFVLPLVGALLLGLADGEALGFSSWNLGLAGVAAIHGLQLRRHGSVRFAAGALLALHMTMGGTTIGESFGAFGHNPLEPLILLGLVAYGIYRKVPQQALVLPTALAAFLVARLGLFGHAMDAVVGIDVAALCLLAWTHRVHGCDAAGVSYRFVGSAMLWIPPTLLAIHPRTPATAGDAALLTAGVTILALLALAVALRQRTYAIPALLIPAKLVHRFAPASAGAWGSLVIGLAFAAVTGGVLVSLQRQRLLAWVEERFGDALGDLEAEVAAEPELERLAA